MPSLVAWSSFLWVIHGRNWKAAWIYIVRSTTRNRFWERHVFFCVSVALIHVYTCIQPMVDLKYGIVWLDVCISTYTQIVVVCNIVSWLNVKCINLQRSEKLISGGNQPNRRYYLVGKLCWNLLTLDGPAGSWLVTCQLLKAFTFYCRRRTSPNRPCIVSTKLFCKFASVQDILHVVLTCIISVRIRFGRRDPSKRTQACRLGCNQHVFLVATQKSHLRPW